MDLSNIGGKSATKISQFFQGVEFPTDKDHLLEHAQSQQTDSELLQALKHIPPGAYDSAEDVLERMGLAGRMTDAVKGFRRPQ
jgi:hydroxypyruvate isomerase